MSCPALHDPKRFAFTAALEAAWPAIAAELDALAGDAFVESPDSLTTAAPGYDERGWQWHALAGTEPACARNLARLPATAAALALVPGLVNAGFSRFLPGTHLEPHRGEIEGVLRCHLALRVPAGDVGMAFGLHVVRWQEGKCVVFDDTHEHEAWNRAQGDRVVLLVTFRAAAVSHHPLVDVAWLQAAYRGLEPKVRSLVTTPFDLWSVTEERRRLGDLGAAVACDVFVWGCDAAPHPATTRLGGVPCLPRSMTWPGRDGVAATFWAQLSFLDSKDLVGQLPGDILLVFKHYVEGITSWDRRMYEFVWVDWDQAAARWQPREVPLGGLDAEAGLHGHRIRTSDHPGLLHTDREACANGLHVLTATKIGGVPSDQQGIHPPTVPATWRFLGQLVSTWPVEGVAHPAIGHPEPVQLGSATFDRLRSGPGSGVLCLYLDEAGCVQVHFSDC